MSLGSNDLQSKQKTDSFVLRQTYYPLQKKRCVLKFYAAMMSVLISATTSGRDPKVGRTLILPSNKDTHHDFLSCFKLTSSIANHNIHLLCNEYNHQTEATIFNKSNNRWAKLNIEVVPVQSSQIIHKETLGPPD